ncbi:hypothetical protein L873DRAFT_422454 [Choiromyces venosus 120613-1]|uniref:Uncharacterized protein n=1 Tax=Choiromyces venosus 120613-1 TaxID=1336337 RepID=A0A3N4JZF6_9PEZI|nr:hypothetical protein L873DRAFT_422454 [Choiromyces venosus 120613-1]
MCGVDVFFFFFSFVYLGTGKSKWVAICAFFFFFFACLVFSFTFTFTVLYLWMLRSTHIRLLSILSILFFFFSIQFDSPDLIRGGALTCMYVPSGSLLLYISPLHPSDFCFFSQRSRLHHKLISYHLVSFPFFLLLTMVVAI